MTEFANVQLNPIHQWGVEIIKTVQLISNPQLDFFIKILTDVLVYGFIIIPIIYIWCADYKKGLNLFYIFIFGTGINEGLKLFFRVPRPYTHYAELMKTTEKGFSTPSGHSVTGAMMYPSVFFYGKNTKALKVKIFLSFFFPVLIGFTRIYLGVHYPTDVLFGLILGGILSFCFIFFAEKIENKIITFSKNKNLSSEKNIKSIRFAAAAFFAFIITIICKEQSKYGGILLGLAFGNIYIQEKYYPDFNAKKGGLTKKIIRLILGLIFSILPILLFYKFGIKKTNEQYNLFSFLIYFITGISISGLMPLLFFKLKLCGENNANK